MVSGSSGSSLYEFQSKKIEKQLEKNVKNLTRSVGWDLLFSAGDTNQNKGKRK